MNNNKLRKLLDRISSASASRASKYGVHYYENDNGYYRSCPEEFVVGSVYDELVRDGWYVSAEAHQAGIWQLCGNKKRYRGGARKRYDLAVFEKKGTPVAVCEFKWGFYFDGFIKDAKNVYDAGEKLGIHPLLCLLVVKPQKDELDPFLTEREYFMKEKYGIRMSSRSRIRKTKRFFCGRHYDDEYSYIQTLSLCLDI